MSTHASAAHVTDAATTPQRGGRLAVPLLAVGSAVLVLSAFLSWSYDRDILGNIGLYGSPGTLQYLALALGAVGLVVALTRPFLDRLGWFDRAGAARALGVGTVAYVATVIVAIALEAGGAINVDPGGWVALVGAALMAVGGWLLPRRAVRDSFRFAAPAWLEILLVVALLAFVLFGAAFALGQDDGGAFVASLVFAGALAAVAVRGGMTGWFQMIGVRHRRVLMLGALAVAFFFPFTQDGSDANMSIATSVLIFATTALGLNIVVGLAGLLDLGYIAFLGAGAYVAAMMSGAAAATIGWQPPFVVVMLIGAVVSAVLGLIIGSPTLRVSGDYLAIVTLAFGEIFRIAVNNMDGSNGPDLTHGPNGIPGIPDLVLPTWLPLVGGFDFGESHEVLGFELGRLSNYYFLLLLIAVFVIVVFSRLNDSRIGRGWVAIREDERAAEAMGVNVFGLKLLAFAGGAFLAGLAGTVKAHQDISVSPDSYQFLESAFLLAAVVLGGMGTVSGVLLGAMILKLLPEKLRFINDYRLLMFGVLLVVMMRFRPEGMIPSRRRQLELHDDEDELAEQIGTQHVEAAR